jgi:protein-tyrosine-phosphatase
MHKVLFICRGNVGRSQFGEMFLRQLRPDFKVASAGTWVSIDDGEDHSNKKLGEYGDGFKNVLTAMDEVGIDVRKNSRTQLTEQMLKDFDEVIVMAEPYSFPDYFSNYPHVEFWTVPDAKDTDLEFHRRVRDEVKKKVEERFGGLT